MTQVVIKLSKLPLNLIAHTAKPTATFCDSVKLMKAIDVINEVGKSVKFTNAESSVSSWDLEWAITIELSGNREIVLTVNKDSGALRGQIPSDFINWSVVLEVELENLNRR